MLNLGFQQGSTGTVVAVGPGSRLDVRGPSDGTQTELIDGVLLSRGVVANVGYNGQGQLQILNGAQAAISGIDVTTGAPAGFLNIGRNPGSVGNVLVSGTGSELRVATAIGVGTPDDVNSTAAQAGGVAKLALAGGATVHTQAVRVGPGGALTGDGLIVADVVNSGGIIAPGLLTINGDFVQEAGFLFFDIGALGEQFLTVTGTISFVDEPGAIRVLPGEPIAAGTALELIHSGAGDVLRLTFSGTEFVPLGTGVFQQLLAREPDFVAVSLVPEPATVVLLASAIMVGAVAAAWRR